MQQSDWMDLLIVERKRYGKLNEIFDLTKQLAEAIDREDQVSVKLLLSMRQEPILRLKEICACTELAMPNYPPLVAEILKGEPTTKAEAKPLADQVATNRRLSDRILSLDERINRKMGGKKSLYAAAGK